MLTQAVFWTFAALAVLSAAMCITRRNPVASALWLVLTLFALAALFVVLDAQFIAVLQVLVYAGAIMVLFLFVIMLLNLGRAGPSDIKGPVGLAVAALLAGGLGLQLVVLRDAAPGGGGGGGGGAAPGALAPVQARGGVVGGGGEAAFPQYTWPL